MAFDFEKALVGETVPLGVQSDFFIGLKKFATPTMVQNFAAPAAQVLALMADSVKAELETVYAYQTYAQTLRHPARDAIAEHFNEHAEDELEHMDFLLRRMAVLGGSANVPEIEPPPPATDIESIVDHLVNLENIGIGKWQTLLAAVGEDPMRIKVEEYMEKEQEHADDLMQLVPAVAAPDALVGPKVGAARWVKELRGGAKEVGEKVMEYAQHRGGGSMLNHPTVLGAPAIAGLERGAGRAGAGDWRRQYSDFPIQCLRRDLKSDKPYSFLPSRTSMHSSDAAVLRNAENAAGKTAEVFGVGGLGPQAPPDGYIQVMISKGYRDRTVRTPSATVAWESQGESFKHASAIFKRAFDEMALESPGVAIAGGRGDEPGSESQPIAAPTAMGKPAGPKPVDPGLASYLGAERAAGGAENKAQLEYYRQLAQNATQAAGATSQQLAQVQQQATEMQAQIQQSQQQIEQAMQQAQAVQQQAMNTALSAQQIASQSQQAHMQAVSETMLHKQMSEQMRVGIERMKANIQSALSEDPTQGYEMQAGASGGGGAPSLGPEAAPGGPAAQATSPDTAPGEVPPSGEAAPTAPATGEAPGITNESATPNSEVKTSGAKVDAILRAAKKHGPWAGVGAGAGVTAALVGRPHAKGTKKELDDAERSSSGSAVGDLQVAKRKVHHAVAEWVDKHPAAGAAILGTSGATAVGGTGPRVTNIAKRLYKELKNRKRG